MFNHPLIQSGKVIPSPGVDMPSSSVLINQYAALGGSRF